MKKLLFSLLSLFVLLSWGSSVYSQDGANDIVVNAGETKSNGDVTVQNSSSTKWTTARISPGTEVTDKANSKIKTRSKFSGSISDVEAGDEVDLGSSAENVTIDTKGGVVTVGSNPKNVTINNTADPGGPSTTINLPHGTSISLPPGSSVTIG